MSLWAMATDVTELVAPLGYEKADIAGCSLRGVACELLPVLGRFPG
jgi:hypothetical protein